MNLTTDRLILREFKLEDAVGLFELNADPIVLQFTGDAPFSSIEEAKRFIQNYSHYQEYGFGRWSVLDKGTDEFLGWCGLKYTPEKGECDLGFRLMQKFWNKGYATEAAIASLSYGFNELNLKEIVGRAMIDNKASVAVLRKVGMFEEKQFDFDGKPGVQYKIDAHSFNSNFNS
jgi:[ribosomal protein S5]-alanine N-acetyltransferase